MKRTNLDILLVEDSPSDRLITTEIFHNTGLPATLHAVEDGIEALDFLRRQGRYSEAPRPHIVILDLNLPRKDGRDVLREIRGDQDLSLLPVIVFTSSDRDEDVAEAYRYHANCFIRKSADGIELTETLKRLKTFWSDEVIYPSHPVPKPIVQRRSVAPGEPKRIKILLVEDSPVDAFLVDDALRDGPNQYELKHADRLEDALRHLGTNDFDLIFTDLGLPDSQGLETFERLFAQAGGIPLVVLTGLDDEEIGLQAIKAGAREYLLKKEVNAASVRRTIRYVMERDALEKELFLSQKREAIGRLAGGIAHDFNNLLTVVDGHAMLLMEPSLPPGVLGSAREIHRAATRAAELTRQLLTFSRRQVIKLQAVDLNSLIRQTVNMLRRVLREDIEVELRLAPDLPPTLADGGMIEQVIVNLAVNSRDAMPDGGKFTLETFLSAGSNQRQAPEGFVGLRITDTGCGIPEEHLPLIFDPFFTTKDIGEGTGLGLATVSGIVEQHRGQIKVHSRPNCGTIFEIFLPTAPPSGPAPEPRMQLRKGLIRGTGTVLLVEDESAVRELFKAALQKMGYIVHSAANGRAAAELWSKERDAIDLLITDVVMPSGTSGITLARVFQAEKPNLAVLFMSGYSQELLAGGLDLRVGENFLPKPFSLEALGRAVEKQLGSENLTQLN